MAEGMTPAELYGVVRFITRQIAWCRKPRRGLIPISAETNGGFAAERPAMERVGAGDVANSRYQPKPGFTTAGNPTPESQMGVSPIRAPKNSEPLVFGDRLFVASMGGKVYSLDAGTGCVHWRFDWRGGARASMTIGKLASAPSGFALYLGDDRMFVHAFDAGSGKELWSVRVDDHKVGRITGSPTLFGGLLYVPLSASEETQGNVSAYPCCTFIGTVVALDATSGKQVWKQSILNETSRPTRKNPAGTQMYGPAGGAIWSAPTIDAKRGLVFVATGDSYTEIDHPTSDAVVAMDLKTGKIRWVNQVLANDNFMSGTINGPLGQRGPDFDFGSSPELVTTPGGKTLLITGNKSSIVYAMDPDTGKTVWQTPKLGSGGAGGGVEWGGCDGRAHRLCPVGPTILFAADLVFVALSVADGAALYGGSRRPRMSPAMFRPGGACRAIRRAATAVPRRDFRRSPRWTPARLCGRRRQIAVGL